MPSVNIDCNPDFYPLIASAAIHFLAKGCSTFWYFNIYIYTVNQL